MEAKVKEIQASLRWVVDEEGRWLVVEDAYCPGGSRQGFRDVAKRRLQARGLDPAVHVVLIQHSLLRQASLPTSASPSSSSSPPSSPTSPGNKGRKQRGHRPARQPAESPSQSPTQKPDPEQPQRPQEAEGAPSQEEASTVLLASEFAMLEVVLSGDRPPIPALGKDGSDPRVSPFLVALLGQTLRAPIPGDLPQPVLKSVLSDLKKTHEAGLLPAQAYSALCVHVMKNPQKVNRRHIPGDKLRDLKELWIGKMIPESAYREMCVNAVASSLAKKPPKIRIDTGKTPGGTPSQPPAQLPAPGPYSTNAKKRVIGPGGSVLWVPGIVLVHEDGLVFRANRAASWKKKSAAGKEFEWVDFGRVGDMVLEEVLEEASRPMGLTLLLKMQPEEGGEEWFLYQEDASSYSKRKKKRRARQELSGDLRGLKRSVEAHVEWWASRQ